MFVSKIHKIVSEIREIVEKIEMEVYRQLLVWKMKKFNFSEIYRKNVLHYRNQK